MASTNLRRKDVRADIVTRLTGATVAGAKVYAARVQDLPDDLLPCLCVFTNDETYTEKARTHPMGDAVLNVEVQAVAAISKDAASGAWADTIDDFIDDARDTLLTDGEWIGMFKRASYGGVRTGFSDEGGKRRAFAAISFRLEHTLEFPPTIDETHTLDTVHTEVTAPGSGATGQVIVETHSNLTR
jgi:hypothetical protein